MNKKTKDVIKTVWRFPFQRLYRLKLRNRHFSLITCNCIGGALSNDLGQQFRSPTVNLIIPEYLKFAGNLKHYLGIPIVPGVGVTPHGWPIGMVGDIQILGVHYQSYDDLSQAWERRRIRVNFDNIFLIATDEYIKTPQDIESFSKLPYPKVLFKSHNEINYNFEVYIPGSDKRDNVGDLLRYADISGIRLFEKYFDCVGWLNTNAESE